MNEEPLLIGNDYDVTIVGAGPAGSSTAVHLARAGLRVLLLDKARFPRYKVCGGGLVYRSLTHLPKGLEEVVECSCYRADLIHHHPHLQFTTVRSEPIVSMVMRDRLDLFLVEAAREVGAAFQGNCQVLGLQRTSSRITLETTQTTLRTHFLIGADGARSCVARLGGWQPPGAFVPALETELKVPDALRLRFDGTARFDFGVIEHGYAWVFPKGQQLSVGVATLAPRRVNLNKALESYLGLLGIVGQIQSMDRHGSVLSLGPRKGGLYRDRVLLVGDAAGVADPITGEGIGPALLNGKIAAEAILQGQLEPENVAEAYKEALKGLLGEIRIARTLAPLLYRFPSVRKALFRLYGQRLSEAMTDIFMGRRTYAGILSEPRNYLRLLNLEPQRRKPA